MSGAIAYADFLCVLCGSSLRSLRFKVLIVLMKAKGFNRKER
jgi:hypothetical protein